MIPMATTAPITMPAMAPAEIGVCDVEGAEVTIAGEEITGAGDELAGMSDEVAVTAKVVEAGLEVLAAALGRGTGPHTNLTAVMVPLWLVKQS